MLYSKIQSNKDCLRKISYINWESAEKACLSLMEDTFSGKVKFQKHGYLMAYFCENCHLYHIGHSGSYITRRAMNKVGMRVWVNYFNTGPAAVTGKKKHAGLST